MDCNHEKTIIRRRVFTDGSSHFAEQCLNCGSKVGNWLKSPAEGAEEWDTVLAEHWDRQEQVEREIRRCQRSEDRRREYREYLQSPGWKSLRDRVLERDRICRGCLTEEATIVHHLTYEHVFD